MRDQHVASDLMASQSSLGKVVRFHPTTILPLQSTTSVSILTSTSSTSLTLPLIAERPGARFKLVILLLGLLFALIVGLILSLLFVTQLLSVPTGILPSRRFHTIWSKTDDPSQSLDQLDPTVDACRDFHGFVCRKWSAEHPLSPLDLKRSWLTERSDDIRRQFAESLANLSETQASSHRMAVKKSAGEGVTRAPEIIDFDGLTSMRNE